MRIRAVIIEGEADPVTIAAIRQAMEAPELTIVFNRPRIADIVARVAYEAGVSVADIVGTNRTQRISRVRFAATLLARRLTGKSSSQIGCVIGDRDHSTILKALIRAEEIEAVDPAFRRLLANVTAHFEQERLQ